MVIGRKPANEIPCLDWEYGMSVTHVFGKGSKEKITVPDKWEIKKYKYVADSQRSEVQFIQNTTVQQQE